MKNHLAQSIPFESLNLINCYRLLRIEHKHSKRLVTWKSIIRKQIFLEYFFLCFLSNVIRRYYGGGISTLCARNVILRRWLLRGGTWNISRYLEINFSANTASFLQISKLRILQNERIIVRAINIVNYYKFKGFRWSQEISSFPSVKQKDNDWTKRSKSTGPRFLASKLFCRIRFHRQVHPPFPLPLFFSPLGPRMVPWPRISPPEVESSCSRWSRIRFFVFVTAVDAGQKVGPAGVRASDDIVLSSRNLFLETLAFTRYYGTVDRLLIEFQGINNILVSLMLFLFRDFVFIESGWTILCDGVINLA